MSALHASDFFTKGRIMTGKTHAAVGLGTVLAVTQPSTVSGLVLAAGTGMLGALISDIDVGTSKSHKDADRITLIAVLLVAAEIALNYFCNFSIWEKIRNDMDVELLKRTPAFLWQSVLLGKISRTGHLCIRSWLWLF